MVFTNHETRNTNHGLFLACFGRRVVRNAGYYNDPSMFNLFRSRKRAVRYVLGGILTLVAFSMVITLIPGLLSNPAEATDVTLGEVDGRPITAQSVVAHMAAQGVSSDLPFNSILLSSTGALDALVEREVLLMEAERFGLFPDEQEVAEWMQLQMPFLFPEGVFVGPAIYARYVRQSFKLGIPEFEHQIAQRMAVDNRLKRLVTSDILVTTPELEEVYRARNEQASIEYIKVSTADFTRQVQVTDEELREAYESEQARHRIPERRTVKLLLVDDSILSVPEVPESRLRQYYARNRATYRAPRQARASHILFMAAMESPDDENPDRKAEAEEVLRKIRDGADFALMAKEHSDDTNAAEGGDLGLFSAGEYPAEFEQAVFDLEPDAVSDVVKTEVGYHIIKLREKVPARTRPFDEVRDELLATLRQETMQRDRFALTDRVSAAAREAGTDLEEVGRQFDLEVRTLPPFSINEPPAELSGDQAFLNALFDNEPGNPALSTEGGITKIGVVSAVDPSRQAEFEEVRDKVRDSLVTQRSTDLAQQRADRIAEEARKPGASLRRVGSRFGARARSSEFFKSSDLVQDIGRASVLGPEPFSGALDLVVGPLRVRGNFLVFRVLERKEADMGNFADEREDIRKTQLDTKREAAFRVYTEAKVAAYEAAGRVRKHEDRVRDFARLYSRGRT